MTVSVDRDLGSLSPAAFQERLEAWITEHATQLGEVQPDESLSVEEATASPRLYQRMLFDAGWLRAGWPAEIGGSGGSAERRAQVYESLSVAGFPSPETLPTLEVLVPALVKYSPELARQFVPAFLRGDELWCQGFSETEAGSDMAAMRTRARVADDGWVITGHKVWNSYASVSDRCVLLARTGEQSDRHRGISAFLVDMDTPGVEARPITTMTGRNELSEIYFEDAFVPADRLIGEVNRGWDFAMFLLQWERGMYAWMRQAWLHQKLARLAPLVAEVGPTRELGATYARVTALRLVARRTLRRLADGDFVGPEASIDKLLLSSCEQAVLDLARSTLRGEFELDDSAEADQWRGDFFYTRSASIYGGAAEIQRDIVATRVLGLPRVR
ncbi:MAG TPA: acyl-CoA dehydrogenase family protein [Nocardioides sp.]|uniref:acyl-CoA dehydrogenase family protein n=1 Tax=Nocardioides sp. TaxID=35761 RepID=UPI002E2FDC94|nr:acyl-CoA dehydrogenase family protein [Nocardioides sp.]HEX3929689.1 acyl-CoA dehydrogenase family protein [Nocardioides sp.]